MHRRFAISDSLGPQFMQVLGHKDGVRICRAFRLTRLGAGRVRPGGATFTRLGGATLTRLGRATFTRLGRATPVLLGRLATFGRT